MIVLSVTCFAVTCFWRSPWVAILLCGLGWALALGFTYERLISIDLILYGASLVLEFAALIALRIKQPDMVQALSYSRRHGRRVGG